MTGGWNGPVLTDAEYWEKLLGRCTVMPSGCWEYQGFRHKPPRHYGEMSFRGKTWRTHRLTYLLNKGSIQRGLVVMHSCDNPPCCNPDHLLVGAPRDNTHDMLAKNRHNNGKKTHCKRGHELAGANLYLDPSGVRHCKACTRERQKLKWRESPAKWEKLKQYRARVRGMPTAIETRWYSKQQLPERFGQPCKIIGRPAVWRIIVEFEDGLKVEAKALAIRPPRRRMAANQLIPEQL